MGVVTLSPQPDQSQTADGLYLFDLCDYSYSRVALQELESVDFRGLLTGRVAPSALTGTVPDTGRWGDLVGTYSALLFLISGRVEQVLLDSQISGWRSVPVQVLPSGPSELKLLQVTGRCGPISAGPRGVGQRVERDSFTPTDMWVPDESAAIVVSKRCAIALADARLVNVEVRPAGIELE